MKRSASLPVVFLVALLALLWLAGFASAGRSPEPAAPQAGAPTMVSYQGQVTVDGTPFTGDGYFQFAIVDGYGAIQWSNDGNSPPIAAVQLDVSSGLFNVLLGDGMAALPASAFAGTDRYLRVWFSSDGKSFEQLSPDRRIAAAPYALQAQEAANAGTLDGYDTGNTAGAIPLSNGTVNTNLNADLLDSYHAGNGSGRIPLSNGTVNTNLNADLLDGYHAGGLPYWSLTGNAGATPANYLGTRDAVTLTLAVSGTTALRIGPGATAPNLIGGYSANWLASGVSGATIGGGGTAVYVNRVTDDFGTVGGGVDNQAGDNAGTTTGAPYATVGGGSANTATGPHATVGGGYSNDATQVHATIGGGAANTASASSATVGGGSINAASGDSATVAGGRSNSAGASFATVGGGFSNNAGPSSYATVAGGVSNSASGERAAIGGGSENTATGLHATVGGGYSNDATQVYATVGGGAANTASASSATVGGGQVNTASGGYATVPGGASNTAAGAYSFAAGYRAKANNAGCFVWADLTAEDYVCSTDNQFAVRATGGVSFTTGAATVQVNGSAVWHAGNDGAGSGLDADLLDGRHALSGACAVGSTIRAINTDGTLVCEAHHARPGFSLTTLDSADTVGQHTSVAIGADGLGLISYHYANQGDLRVAHCNDTACTSAAAGTLDSVDDTGYHTSITIGADGLGLISYWVSTSQDLRVAHCADTACTSATTATLDSGGDVGRFTSITIGADGLGLISYYDFTNTALKVAHCADAACSSAAIYTLDGAGTVAVGEYASITTGADGLGLISYYDITNTALKVAHCADAACSSAAIATLDSAGAGIAGEYTSITIGADGLGLISYHDATNHGLKVAHCANAACSSATTTTLDSAVNVYGTSITTGVDGLGLISYYDFGNYDLKAAHCANAACSSAAIATLDGAGTLAVGEWNSITMGADGLGLIAYFDESSDDLKVAHCANALCTPYTRRR